MNGNEIKTRIIGQLTLPAKNSNQSPPDTTFHGRSFPFLWLFSISCLNIATRLPLLGHMLAWDEAWNLCILKYIAGGGVLFTLDFWRHPPLYMLSGFLLSPLKPGFEYRMEFLSLILSTVALIVFVKLISRLYGRHIALFTAIAYTLLPGPLFFDTWVKRDPIVTIFGILAVSAFFKKKDLLAGLFLGLALLGKETAVFYCAAIFVMSIFGGSIKQSLKRTLLTFGVAFLVAGWWYLLVDRGSAGFIDFYLGRSEEAKTFPGEWWYYLAKLKLDMGVPGMILLVTGSLALLSSRFRSGESGADLKKFRFSRPRYFPFFLLVPAYLFISTSSGKPFWITISLQPALALLTGIGWVFILKLFQKFAKKIGKASPGSPGTIYSVVLLAVFLAFPLTGFNYKKYYVKYAPTSISGVMASHEIPELVNRNVKANERLYILPMLYRSGPAMPDPIIYWQLKVVPDMAHDIDLNIDYQKFKRTVIKNRIQWVLMSPVVGSSQVDILENLIKEIYPVGYRFSQGVLLRVDPLWDDSENKDSR